MGLPWRRALLLLLWLEGGGSLWRYTTTEENYKLFTSRTTVYLEYEGTSFIVWEYPDVCTAKNKSSPKTTLNCPTPGTYRIKPKVTIETFEDKERYFPASDHSNCFMWYVTIASEPNRIDPFLGNKSQELILWVYDPETADASELNRTAIRPSQVLHKCFCFLSVSMERMQGKLILALNAENAVCSKINRLHKDDSNEFSETQQAVLEFGTGTCCSYPFEKGRILFSAASKFRFALSPTSWECPSLWRILEEPLNFKFILDFIYWTYYKYVQIIVYPNKEAIVQRLWTVNVPAESEDIIISIHGKAIAFQECFVLDTPFIIPRPIHSFPNKKNDISLCSPRNSDMSITWSACFPTTAVLLTDFGTFYTSDGFRTYEEIKVPSDALTQGLNNSVTDVVLTDKGILFLINGAIYKRESNHFFKLGAEHKLPEAKITGVCSRYWCPLSYPVQNQSQLSTLAAWTSTELYLMYDEIFHKMTDTTNLVNTLNFPKGAVLSIESVNYDSVPSEITLLLICKGCTSSRLFYLAYYSEDRQLWGLRDFYLPASENSVTRMIYLNSALSCGLLWNNESIYYTYRNNTTNGYFQIFGSNLSLSEVSNGSTIHQIIPDYLGNIVIKMKNNYFFYTKNELRGLVRLPEWIDEKEKMILYVNPSASVYILLTDGSNIYRQTYPLELEIFSSTFKSEISCSIIAFLHNIHFSIYYLDMGDELTFWSQIVFEENVDISTHLEVYRPELLLLRGSSKYEIAGRVSTKNETFTFYHDIDYTLESNYTKALELTSGVMSVELQPSVFEAACKLHFKVAHFFVGCPPGRHIVVERPSNIACLNHDFTTYRIPGKFLWHQTVEDKIAHYDWNKYGCLMELHYEQYFQPVISLYDGDKYVRRVETNFILWEIEGRTDYGYTSTMKEEGCLYKAQSWPMMLNASKNSTLDEIWGPQNYRSCFVFHENSTEEGLYEQYQILNMTSRNSIVWSTSHSGIYVFRVRIIDPNYSFCDLKAFFAVRTYGIIERSDISSVLLYSFFIICIFGAFLILSYFRYTKIFQELKHVDEKRAREPDEQEN